MKALCKAQQEALTHFYSHIDHQKLTEMAHILGQCKGTLFFCGVGKSAYIAQKIAKHCISFGIAAQFICPIHAVHGDLGMVSSQDTVIALSNSGESTELIHFFSFLKKRNVSLALWTSKPQSTLAKKTHYLLEIPFEKELCSFNLSPTTSSVLQLLIGDLIVVYLVNAHGYKKEDYLSNHPLGGIGKSHVWSVKDVMCSREELPLCTPKDTMEHVIVLLNHKRQGCVLIEENQRLVGIFTDGDLKRSLKHPSLLTEEVRVHMTQQVRTIAPNTSLNAALIHMEKNPEVSVLPVVESKKLIGLVTLHSIIQPTLV